MNKVVCNLCGTSYPENAAQCPICGYARSAEAPSTRSGEGTYTYVKGGRFSKANVKKRNQAAHTALNDADFTGNKRPNKRSKSTTGIVILVIILLLAIVAALGYIALRFFLPNDYIYEGLDNLKLPSAATQQEDIQMETDDEISTEPIVETEDTEPDLSCTSVSFAISEVNFDKIGATEQLSVQLEPANTTDTLKYSSSNESIATVSDTGLVTSVSEGTAVITVVCGEVSAECIVICTIPTEEDAIDLSLNRKEITFDVEGQSWLLYDGEIPAADIVWSSDDDSIATIEDGKVIAVSNGDTTVYGTYNGETVSCIIHCKLDEDSSSDSNISEAGSESKRTYRLYNPTGYSDDVTIRVGQKFTLKLVDENKKQVTGATWEVENPKYCSYEDDTVKGLASGTTKVKATYEGVTYTCVVRVIKK